MSDNWVVQNLQNALTTWNEKLAEIWVLLTEEPEYFRGGDIWKVIVDIHGALQAIGIALLVLFFLAGMVKESGSFAEVKRPEQAVKVFIRFIIAKAIVTYGLELMLAIFAILQGIVGTIMRTAGLGRTQGTQGMILPDAMITAIEDCGFFESIPLWAVSLIDRRRTAHAAHRHFFFEILRLGLHGGRDYTFSLRDLFHFRSFAACHRHCCRACCHGLVVSWGTDF